MITAANYLVWNVSGISRRDSQQYLRELCTKNKVRLLILIEPMTGAVHLESIRIFLHFDKSQSFLEGKMCVFWFDDMHFGFHDFVDQFCICIFHLLLDFPFGFQGCMLSV